MKKWAKEHGVHIHYIQPGKPAQNAYIERFNRTYREEALNMGPLQAKQFLIFFRIKINFLSLLQNSKIIYTRIAAPARDFLNTCSVFN